jgi:hypothetical protein
MIMELNKIKKYRDLSQVIFNNFHEFSSKEMTSNYVWRNAHICALMPKHSIEYSEL